MKVSELITALQGMPQDGVVRVTRYSFESEDCIHAYPNGVSSSAVDYAEMAARLTT